MSNFENVPRRFGIIQENIKNVWKIKNVDWIIYTGKWLYGSPVSLAVKII